MSDLSYSMIAARGEDAQDFLQGQLTNDLTRLDESNHLLAAWCNPKGRVICLLRVVSINSGYGLILPSEIADAVLQRLMMFRFRAKVEFAAEPVPSGQKDFGEFAGMDEWLATQIRSGVPEIWLQQSEKYTPHMLNLDLLDAISFDKGCYTGQEIVARTHYRGASKRRCHRFRSAEPVSPGEKVAADQRDVGEVVNAIGNDLLAVVPTDKANEELTVNGIALEHVPLPYLQP